MTAVCAGWRELGWRQPANTAHTAAISSDLQPGYTSTWRSATIYGKEPNLDEARGVFFYSLFSTIVFGCLLFC